MQISGEQVVYANPYPTYRSETFSSTGLCRTWGSTPTLLCAFRVGSARVSPDGRVALAATADEGRSWRSIESPMAAPGHGLQVAGSQIGASSSSPTAVLAAARMTVAAPGSPDWPAEVAGITDADAVIARLGDDGWERAVVFDGRRTPDEWAIPCGPPVSLGGGEWILPLERHAKTHVSRWLQGYHAFAAVSRDDGRTWAERGPLLNDPERRVAHYDQHLAVTDDGRLLSLAWAHDVVDDRTLPARAGWSDDGGRSWSAPHVTGIVGGPLAPVRLPDGRILAVYPRRAVPAGIRACVSEDGGRTWDLAGEFLIWDETVRRVVGIPAASSGSADRDPPLWDTMWAWSFGLPAPALLADGSVGVAFYAAEPDGTPTVRFVVLHP